jgi:hypothetical protein
MVLKLQRQLNQVVLIVLLENGVPSQLSMTVQQEDTALQVQLGVKSAKQVLTMKEF